MPTARTRLTKLAAVAASLMLLAGCAAAPSAPASGETTEVTIKVDGMRFVPDSVEVPVGNELIVTFENTGDLVHDLVFANGTGSAHIGPGQSEKITVGVVSDDLDGWCSVSNHRALGMEMIVRAVD